MMLDGIIDVKLDLVIFSDTGSEPQFVYDYFDRVMPYDEDAEEIEQCVKKMAQQKPKTAEALRIQYLYRGTLHQKAKKINMSDTQFKVYVQMAKQWIAGWIAHVNDNRNDYHKGFKDGWFKIYEFDLWA